MHARYIGMEGIANYELSMQKCKGEDNDYIADVAKM
jgi:hypothetical protein